MLAARPFPKDAWSRANGARHDLVRPCVCRAMFLGHNRHQRRESTEMKNQAGTPVAARSFQGEHQINHGFKGPLRLCFFGYAG